MTLHEETISSEVVYDGALLHVRRDVVRLGDDGPESVREWIRHPGASAVVPLFAGGDTLLIRQFRYPARREFLEVPAGKFDGPHESALDVARRELFEEVGLTATRWTPLGETHPGIGYSDEVIHLFLAEDVTEGEAAPDADERVIPVRLPFAEAVAMAREGQIHDGKSCVALLLADAALARRAAS
jgi:ADP-ribose pyrophosphatase